MYMQGNYSFKKYNLTALEFILFYNHNSIHNYRVFLPGIVGGTTQSPREVLVMEKINLNDYGVIAFGENGKYYIYIFKKYHIIITKVSFTQAPFFS